ncbi:MAG: hypothetical protein IRZ16_11705 [Myxococcaceae bacterium]|nr:hypothetical protein [Myxococcaceae bacterium]
MKRMFLTAALVLVAPLVAGCPGGDTCGEPIYGPGSTDEAWLTMVDGEKSVKVDDDNAATITQPTEGAQIPADGPAPLIQWTSPLSAAREHPVLDGARYAVAPRKARTPSVGEWILEAILPTAHAHLPPITGPIHVLEISVTGEDCPVRVLTTKDEWQVGSETWALLKAHRGETIRLTVTSAYLTENRITEGPYRASTPRTFTVQ